jgi:hypothetical protein
LFGIVDGDAPDFAAGFLVERYQEIVGGTEEDLAIRNGDAAIQREDLAPGASGPRHGRQILPEERATGRIEREHLVMRGDEIHHAIDDQRRGLKAIGGITGLEDPGGGEARDARGVDVIERAVTPGRLRAAIVGPIGAGGSIERLRAGGYGQNQAEKCDPHPFAFGAGFRIYRCGVERAGPARFSFDGEN